MLNEAWAKMNFGEGFFAQLGRQSLIYDDERILGGLDWNVAGRRGCRINAEPAEGGGFTVYFTIPRR
jgi:hypothetical protein